MPRSAAASANQSGWPSIRPRRCATNVATLSPYAARAPTDTSVSMFVVRYRAARQALAKKPLPLTATAIVPPRRSVRSTATLPWSACEPCVVQCRISSGIQSAIPTIARRFQPRSRAR